MQNTKKLLSISNLKKYFPVAKSSFFQKEQLYVRANEDISLDIYEGETIGVVGESGCGKSTLGRVLLQLYAQTAGNTMYYGATLDEITPRYVADTLQHLDKYRARLTKAGEKAAELDRQVSAVGEDKADFYLLQERNLARCEEQTCLNAIVKILGGFYAKDEGGKGRELLQKVFDENVKRNKLKTRYQDSRGKYDYCIQQGMDESKAKVGGLKKTLEELREKMEACDRSVAACQQELDALRVANDGDAEFVRYEAMRDSGIDLARLKYSEMRLLRKDLQIIFQDPYSSLNPRLTIGQIIEEGLVTHKFYKHGSPKMREHIVETMKKCGLQEYMLHRYPHQFSGGQRQRVAIARALAVGPKFIVCDECVSALDVSIQSQIINLLQELKEKENLTYMFISHDLSVVRYISDRICVMYLGNIVELGDAKTVFEDPRHPYTVALMSSIPTTDPEALSKERILLEGNIPSPIKPPTGCKFHTRCYMACDKCKRVPPELKEVEPGHFLACHFPERKIDREGNYMFELPKMERKSNRFARKEDAAD
ncbi:ATP-binding cassette domain-containing protein [Acetatifactor muris]|uniref:Oligopeptide transport ATP-binding protein OppF n=1 Tax=Acetatifactor muris TaxID=879566 RepID=A0A2K4ZMU7_9FIRM|nr:oligopeptide/dipeptide ABC transporter ATP-binding protein [Acetatifactor muris]MCR2050153.1 ATP-binding cassette domain-containing protein [Acetatifactor muris]SOY31814.1 Oligopeptide transport ATP-binding protein OppF [Acetatifactor muris]